MSSAGRDGDGNGSDGSSTRSLGEISEEETLRVGSLIGYTTNPTISEAIRRYDELWMPLISDLTVGSNLQMVLPPIDIEWVWFCHTLNPVSYRQYCESRFSKLIGKPAIFNEENEEYALTRCRDIWISRYPSESFENELGSDESASCVTNEELLSQVLKLRNLYTKFAEPYMLETVYLIAARKRYKRFLYLMQRFSYGCGRLVPASDILLMWVNHQSYPMVYEADTREMEGDMGKVAVVWEEVNEEEVEETKKLWVKTFDQPYETAGGETNGGAAKVKPPVHWEVADDDVNVRYKSMLPRFLLEVCVFVKLDSKTKAMQGNKSCEFLRLRTVRCHRELKIDKQVSTFPLESWHKAWHLYCEFGTRGVVLDLRVTVVVAVSKEVTDDSGAMISDVILRMNQYHPQEGRWLSRTVLDHAGRECFVVRMRVGDGFWRRGAETPTAVKWEDRITEIREGSWSYVAGSIGRAPAKVVGTATPIEPSEQWNASWKFSTGDELMIHWEASTSQSGLRCHLKTETSSGTTVKLLVGRKMQYQRRNTGSRNKEYEENTNIVEADQLEGEGEEDGFMTLVRFSEDNPIGKATALLNWKLLVVEFSPEEDAVFVLLLCISILRSVSEMRKEDVGNLLIRRRLKEARLGDRDWASVILHPSSCSPSISSPHLQLWYCNAKAVMASDDNSRLPTSSYSLVEGGDKLFKRGLISFLSYDNQTIHSMIFQTCNNVGNQTSCLSNIQARLGKLDNNNPTSILKAALEATLNEARLAIDMVTKFNTLSVSLREQIAIQDCKELLDFSVSELAWSLAEMNKIRAGSRSVHTEGNLKAWLSAALSNQDTCLEGFEGTDRRLARFIKGSLAEKHTTTKNKPNPTLNVPKWMTEGDKDLLVSDLNGMHVDAVVALDGTGRYNTIAQAIYEAPSYSNRRNYGPGGSLSGRVQWPGYHKIRDASAANFFTVGRFIDGMSWLPSTGITFTVGLSN
ncbi:enolase [Actinidia rufa]|uniref:Enolase n=1 Tax=Actinidia rufa TaxID=165716 RepID=A0A7J0G8Q8_9ERIC|nr:enolase [Actinidia rufa]